MLKPELFPRYQVDYLCDSAVNLDELVTILEEAILELESLPPALLQQRIVTGQRVGFDLEKSILSATQILSELETEVEVYPLPPAYQDSVNDTVEALYDSEYELLNLQGRLETLYELCMPTA